MPVRIRDAYYPADKSVDDTRITDMAPAHRRHLKEPPVEYGDDRHVSKGEITEAVKGFVQDTVDDVKATVEAVKSTVGEAGESLRSNVTSATKKTGSIFDGWGSSSDGARDRRDSGQEWESSGRGSAYTARLAASKKEEEARSDLESARRHMEAAQMKLESAAREKERAMRYAHEADLRAARGVATGTTRPVVGPMSAEGRKGVVETMKEGVESAGSWVADKTQEAGEAVASTARAATDKVMGGAEAVMDKVSGAGERIKDDVVDAKDRVVGAGEHAMDRMKAAGERVKDDAIYAKDRAIGSAARAKNDMVASGERWTEDAKFLRTRADEAADRWRTDARWAGEKVRDGARGAARELGSEARATRDRVDAAAERWGRDAGRAKESLESSATRAKSSLESAATRAKDAVESAAERAKDGVESAVRSTRHSAEDAARRAKDKIETGMDKVLDPQRANLKNEARVATNQFEVESDIVERRLRETNARLGQMRMDEGRGDGGGGIFRFWGWRGNHQAQSPIEGMGQPLDGESVHYNSSVIAEGDRLRVRERLSERHGAERPREYAFDETVSLRDSKALEDAERRRRARLEKAGFRVESETKPRGLNAVRPLKESLEEEGSWRWRGGVPNISPTKTNINGRDGGEVARSVFDRMMTAPSDMHRDHEGHYRLARDERRRPDLDPRLGELDPRLGEYDYQEQLRLERLERMGERVDTLDGRTRDLADGLVDWSRARESEPRQERRSWFFWRR